MDTLVALIAGFIIVPAVFATLGAEGVGKGAGFAFSSLAGVFQQMPGGQFFGILFYMLLLFAALTSCISLVEGVVAFATERFGWKRTPTTIILCVVMFLLGTIIPALRPPLISRVSGSTSRTVLPPPSSATLWSSSPTV